MKVLVTGTGGAIVSGISSAADEMVRTLPALGHDAERLVAGAAMRQRANRLNAENLLAVWRDARAVFRRARHADVVWIHTIGVPTLPAWRALVLVIAARLARRPAVVHFHAFGLEDAVRNGGRALRVTIWLLARLAGAFVALHESAAAALRAAGASTVLVVHNWVEVPATVEPMPALPPLRLVFVGGVVRRKGAPQLIDAMRLLDDLDVELHLVGGPAEDGVEALGALRRASQDLVDRGRVVFEGELDPPGVRAALRAANVFVLPSDAEGTPLAMLEALAEGRPVLVTEAGNMADVVRETGCGWVLPDRRPATIGSTVRTLAADGAELAERGELAHRAAVARYAPTAAASSIDAVLAAVPRRRGS